MTLWILSSSVLILLMIGLRAVLKGKLAPWLQYALWLVVLVRLLVPGSLTASPMSIENLLPETEAPAIVETTEELPTVTTNNVIIPTQTAKPEIPIPEHSDSTEQVSYSPDAETILMLVWRLGMGVTAVILLFSNLWFYCRLYNSRVRLELPHRLPIYVSEGLPSPCLFGLLPAVYVPAADDAQVLEHMLAHEESHYLHGDHIWSLLRSAALVLHWYNPLVWLAVVLSKQDAELACDAAAIRRLGEEHRIAYGQTLLQLIVSKPKPADLLSCATTMTSGKKSLKQRISLIARKPKMLAITVICVILVTALAVGCTFTGAETNYSIEADEALLSYGTSEYRVRVAGEELNQLLELYSNQSTDDTSQPMALPGRITIQFRKDDQTHTVWHITQEGICANTERLGNYLWTNDQYEAVEAMFWNNIHPDGGIVANLLHSRMPSMLTDTQIQEIIAIYRDMKLMPTTEEPAWGLQLNASLSVGDSFMNLFQIDETGIVSLFYEDEYSHYTCENGTAIYQKLSNIYNGIDGLSTAEILAREFMQEKIYEYDRFGIVILSHEITGLTLLTDANSPYQAWLLEYKMEQLNSDQLLTEETEQGQPVILVYEDETTQTNLGVTWTKVVETEMGGDYEKALARAMVDFEARMLPRSIEYLEEAVSFSMPEEDDPENWKYELNGRYEAEDSGYSYHATLTPGQTISLNLDDFTELWLVPVYQGVSGSAINVMPLLYEQAVEEITYTETAVSSWKKTHQEAADLWAASWGADLMELSEANPAKLTDYQVGRCEVVAMPSDGSEDAMVIGFVMAIQDQSEDLSTSLWMGDGCTEGTGAWYGWIVMQRYATLERDGNLWRCTYMSHEAYYEGEDWQIIGVDFQNVLSQQTLSELSQWLSQIDNYGFLLSEYDHVTDVSLHQVFYDGAGLENYDNKDYVNQRYQPRLDMTCLKASDMDAFLKEKTGYGLSDMTSTLSAWDHWEEEDLYCLEHGDTNRNGYTCTGGYATKNGTYVVEYQPQFGAFIESKTFSEGVVVLRVLDDGYRFVSNQTGSLTPLF